MKQKYEDPNKDLSDFSIEDLASELAHRRAQAISFDMLEAEQALNDQHDQDRAQAFSAYLLRLSQSQDSEPKTCPQAAAWLSSEQLIEQPGFFYMRIVI